MDNTNLNNGFKLFVKKAFPLKFFPHILFLLFINYLKDFYELKSGIPRNKKIFANTNNLKGRPDGAAVDANGFYWVAGVEGSELYRFNKNGKIDTIINLPVEKPTKLVFGGKNFDIIYITSIGQGFNKNDKSELNGFTLEISNHTFKGFALKEYEL